MCNGYLLSVVSWVAGVGTGEREWHWFEVFRCVGCMAVTDDCMCGLRVMVMCGLSVGYRWLGWIGLERAKRVAFWWLWLAEVWCCLLMW